MDNFDFQVYVPDYSLYVYYVHYINDQKNLL